MRGTEAQIGETLSSLYFTAAYDCRHPDFRQQGQRRCPDTHQADAPQHLPHKPHDILADRACARSVRPAGARVMISDVDLPLAMLIEMTRSCGVGKGTAVCSSLYLAGAWVRDNGEDVREGGDVTSRSR